MIFLTIDPGFSAKGEGCACAAFEGPTIDTCVCTETWYERLPTSLAVPGGSAHATLAPRPRVGVNFVLVEQPEYQGLRTQLARVQDSMRLCWEGALVAASLAGREGCPIEAVGPNAWKRQLPKPIHHAKVLRAITAAESAYLPDNAAAHVRKAQEKGAAERWAREGAYYYGKWQGHNILDAIALGLWRTGRLVVS